MNFVTEPMHSETVDAVAVRLAPLIALRFAARGIDLPGARRVAGSHAGPHPSRFRGRGVDFLESRAYQAGDDIRNIDWRVTARSGRAHTKLFQEERERNVLLVVDYAPSLRFGTRRCFKSVQAARAAALVAWNAARGGDRVGAVGFGSGIDAEVRPVSGPRGALHCLRALVEWDAQAKAAPRTTPLSVALERTRRLVRPGSFTLLLTDGFSADQAAEAPLSRLAEHGDVATILLCDPLERAAPLPGRYAVLVDGVRRVFDFGNASRDACWAEAFSARRERLLALSRRCGVTVLPVSTIDDPACSLAGLLRTLSARRRMA